MCLIVQIPDKHFEEYKYIINVLFSHFLFIKYYIEVVGGNNVVIRQKDDIPDKKIIIKGHLLTKQDSEWLEIESLPKQPLKKYNLSAISEIFKGIYETPVIYGSSPDNNLIRVEGEVINIGLDIFGSAFFMLTRYEEIVKNDCDYHNRFPAYASLAYQEGFLDRPIVNEYVEILWRSIHHLWPNIERKERKFRLVLSHDVDIPFKYVFNPFIRLLKTCADDVLRHKNPFLTLKNLNEWIDVNLKRKIEKDPNNTFDLIMSISERYNLKSSFFFIASGNSYFDGRYPLRHDYLTNVLKKIKKRGHLVGLHPTYNSYNNPKQIIEEFDHLTDVCTEMGIDQETWGGRQHYLRWEAPYTWQYYSDAGLNYDATLCYADYPGFRCGTCYEYPVFNLLTSKELPLNERPLIAMESTLLSRNYMALGHLNAYNILTRLIDECKVYKGDFSLLWHNSMLNDEKDINLYTSLIDYCAN